MTILREDNFKPFSPTLFLIVAKRVYQSIHRHTGLTHPFNFFTSGHSGTQY